ncbi:MAG TPA: YifB family Mg chelatase-like AAA ATPase [Peptococcaceae bacterium]|nr:YifB family Mg chelatase-like AAA ATPase [Peptococcaceae bacterium]
MFASVCGMSVEGLSAHLVRVEVDICSGLPAFDIVGLPAVAVKEAKDRVRSALKNSGFQFPLQRITVNLAPADLRKEGSSLDLPIAVGILAAMGEIDPAFAASYVFAGELSLEGILRPIPGILTMAVSLRQLKTELSEQVNTRQDLFINENIVFVIPPGNLAEARLVPELHSESTVTLIELVKILRGEQQFNVVPVSDLSSEYDKPIVDWADIRGQTQAKRALEIAATGGHNLLMVGPPGSGKTLLARAFAGILPPLTTEESLEVTQLYSSAGLLQTQGRLVTQRPFRSPHHTATVTSMIGGGQKLRPGELVLANHGVLFLDELPEFSREVLEALRQPLEDRKITITRLRGSMEYPTRVSVIAAMNPCHCGYFGDLGRVCTCTPLQINNYRSKISGPLLDRFDLQIEVPRLSYAELKEERKVENSEQVRERVVANRQKQWRRFKSSKTNAEMTGRETKEVCILDSAGESLLKQVFDKNLYSARAYDRILRVARTIADMAGSEVIKVEHLAESLQYRALDRQANFG